MRRPAWAWVATMLVACAAVPPRAPPRFRPPLPAVTDPLVVAADEPFRRRPPPALAPRPHPLPTIESFLLANGLTVYVLSRPGEPSLAVRLVCRRCGDDDPVAPAGLAQLTLGALVRTDRAARPTGVRISSSVSDEMGVLSAAGDYAALPDLVQALAHLVRQPRWDPRAFQDERNALALEQSDVLVDLVRTAVFGISHPLGRHLASLRASLQGATPAFAQAFFALHFVPSESALVVVGDVTPTDVQRAATAAFDAWPSAPPAPRVALPIVPLAPRVMFLDVRGLLLSRIMVALPGVSHDHPDFAAMLLLEQLLGGIFTSRTNRSLRETLGLAYSTEGFAGAFRDAGIFVLSTQVSLGDAVPTVVALRAELRRVIREPISAEDLALVRAVTRGSLRAEFEGVGHAAAAIEDLFAHAEGVDALARLDARLEAVTPADIQRLAAHHFGAAHMQVAMTGDRRVIGDSAARALGTMEFIGAGD